MSRIFYLYMILHFDPESDALLCKPSIRRIFLFLISDWTLSFPRTWKSKTERVASEDTELMKAKKKKKKVQSWHGINTFNKGPPFLLLLQFLGCPLFSIPLKQGIYWEDYSFWGSDSIDFQDSARYVQYTGLDQWCLAIATSVTTS